MTDDNQKPPYNSYDPAAMAVPSSESTVLVWYKRPRFLIALAIVVVLGVSVITDLPRHITKAQDASEQNDSIHQINTDVAPCVYAVQQSFTFYQEHVTGQLSAAHLKQVPALLVGDQTACSFASGGIYDLTNNIQVNDTAAGKHIDRMLSVIVTWATSDALAAIEDIQYLFVHPGNATKIAKLSKREALLAEDKVKIDAAFQAAENLLGITLKSPKIPSLANLSGT
ncbi:MAG: hypothetical protein WA786_10065 [Acidimicrobiales bacterium]